MVPLWTTNYNTLGRRTASTANAKSHEKEIMAICESLIT
jgi:hypothetical protein